MFAIVYSIIIASGSAFALTLSSDSEPGISVFYGENAQFEIVSPSGIHVYIDVHDPSAISVKGTIKDILLTTHHHPDHINTDMLDEFAGRQLDMKTGTLESGDVKVTGIASAHNAGDPFSDEGGTNYIFIIETAGLRIAHFGDIGQDALTKEQLAVLGKIDIAMTQFDNSYSGMNTANRKGLRLMEQLKPRLIIPTHIGEDAVKLLGKSYPALYTRGNPVRISKGSLPDRGTVLFLGIIAKVNGMMVKGKEIK
jgi:hypothetical protein